MASFDTPEIQEMNVQSSFTAPSVDTSRADLIKSLGQGAGAIFDTYKVQQEKTARERIQAETEKTGKVVATINEALEKSGKSAAETFDARTGTLNLIPDAPDDFNQRLAEVMKEAGDEFRAIASGVAQGAVPKIAAAPVLQAKLREYVARYPAFAPELRAVVRDNAGYDPTGYHLKQILDITAKAPKTTLTYGQKLAQKAEAWHEALGNDSPGIEILKHNIAKSEMLETTDAIKASQINGNQEAAREMINQSVLESGPNTAAFYLHQAKAVAENGGVLNPEAQKSAIANARAQHSQYLKRRAFEAGDHSAETAKYIEDQLDSIYKPMQELTDDNEFGKILLRQNNVLMELDKRSGRNMFPELVMLKNSMSAEFAGKVLDHMMTFTDPAVAAQYRKNWPVLSRLIDNFSGGQKQVAEKMMNVYAKVAGNQPLTQDDIEWAKGLEPLLTSSDAPKPVRENYYNTLGTTDARGVGWLAQPGRRNEADEVDIAFMKREWKDTMPALVKKVASELVENDKTKIEVDANGNIKMLVKQREFQRKGVKQSGYAPMIRKEVEQLNYFIHAGKNGWGFDFGVAPGNIVKEITDRITKEAEAGEIAKSLEK